MLPSARLKHSVPPVHHTQVSSRVQKYKMNLDIISTALHHFVRSFYMLYGMRLVSPCTQSSTIAIVTCSLLRVIRTANDDSCDGELGMRLWLIWRIVRDGGCLVIVALIGS